MSGAESVTTVSTKEPEHDLEWLLQNLKERTPGVRHVLVLSKDGLRLCFTEDLDIDRADQLSAMAAGIQSLALSASAEFGSELGSGQSMVEFPGGVLLIVPAGEGAHLAVVAADEADVGLVGHNMSELVEQIGDHLTSPPRQREANRAS
ncbi:MAG TPA: roadblock/LC7 domain-containing protein [Trebonia sp.]|jgi:predicted regulator of Ras-like GTPase activity (Roadblock/LC7/MglB family)